MLAVLISSFLTPLTVALQSAVVYFLPPGCSNISKWSHKQTFPVGCRNVMIVLLSHLHSSLYGFAFCCLQTAPLNIPINPFYSRSLNFNIRPLCAPAHYCSPVGTAKQGLTVVQHVLLNCLYFLAVALPHLYKRQGTDDLFGCGQLF